MKKVLVPIVALLLASTAVAGETAEAPSRSTQAEQNLLIGLASDNVGLQESAAYLLGEMNSDHAVIPLMRMLRSERESARVVAALALCRIGDARGVYAVRRASTFDESAQVRQRCAWFYEQYVAPGSFAFMAETPAHPEQMAVR
jgi:HEAT repeat protein